MVINVSPETEHQEEWIPIPDEDEWDLEDDEIEDEDDDREDDLGDEDVLEPTPSEPDVLIEE